MTPILGAMLLTQRRKAALRTERLGINRREDPAKGVVRGNAMFEPQIPPEPEPPKQLLERKRLFPRVHDVGIHAIALGFRIAFIQVF